MQSNYYHTFTDVYAGFHITVIDSPPIEKFTDYLNELEASKHYLTIWIELNTTHLPLLDICTNQLAYSIHHAIDNKIVVYKWLSAREDLVVPYSVFLVAAGALVIKDDKLLLVQEKSGERKGYYGIPGGRADRGQLIAHCAQRQLLEETGIREKFKRVVLFRELTKGNVYDCVDIYFICLMEVDQQSIKGLKICETELTDYAWVPLAQLQQFCAHKSIGTMLQMSKHVAKLYHQKRLFEGSQYQHELNLAQLSCHHHI